MLVDFGKAGWLGKARQQPEKVRAVLDKIRSDGALATWEAVRAKLEMPIALGYCNVGIVVNGDWRIVNREGSGEPVSGEGSGEPVNREWMPVNRGTQEPVPTIHHSLFTNHQPLSVGDRVVSNSPHAEVVSVSEKLCAKIPDNVTDAAATFTPLAAIAWEGISLLDVKAGDRVVVTGLGLIGQLAVRVLRALNCEVLGFDPAADRRALAERQGAETAPGDPVTAALGWSVGKGVAGVLITASSASNEIVNQAARSCRHRGRVVLVGVVGLQLNRADFYKNEVSFQVSCSYGARDHTGPGSARANFDQILQWMAEGKLPVEDLITHRFPFESALTAYEALQDRSALGILLEYGTRPGVNGDWRMENRKASGASVPLAVKSESGSATGEGGQASEVGAQSLFTIHQSRGTLFERTIVLRESQKNANAVSVAVIGAGNFASRTLLPAMMGLKSPPELVSVVSNQGVSAYLAAEKFGAARASTDVETVLADKAIEAVFITTRHDDHSRQVIAALGAGKAVWVEKPLCLTIEDLGGIERMLPSGLENDGRNLEVGGRKSEVRGRTAEDGTENAQRSTFNAQLSTAEGEKERSEVDGGPSGAGSEPSTFKPNALTSAARGTSAGDGPRSIRRPLTSDLRPLLVIGFNRRFSPLAVALRDARLNRGGSIRIQIEINAGRLPSDHWALDPKAGGGRIVGEACHFVDLSRYLVGQPIARANCTRRDEDGQDGGCFELAFADGSMAVIDYRTDLPPHVPKERIVVSGQGWSATIHNWARLTSSGLGGLRDGGFWSRAPRKGHPEALGAFLGAVRSGVPPMPVGEIFEVSRWAVVMQGMKASESQ